MLLTLILFSAHVQAAELQSPKNVPLFTPGEYRLVIDDKSDPDTIRENCTPGNFKLEEDHGIKILQLGGLHLVTVANGTDTLSYRTDAERMTPEDVKDKCVYTFVYSYTFKEKENYIELNKREVCGETERYKARQVVKLQANPLDQKPMIVLDYSQTGNIDLVSQASSGYRCVWLKK